MNTLPRAMWITGVAVSAVACTSPRAVEADYAAYLHANPVGEIILPTASKASGYFLSAATRKSRYQVQLANEEGPWLVEIGAMLGDTLRSAAVQASFGGIVDVGKSMPASGSTLVFDIKRYAFTDYVAQLTLEVALRRGDREVFRKTYSTDGRSQGNKPFSGITFGQKNAIQKSTRLAIDKVLVQLIGDLDALPGGG